MSNAEGHVFVNVENLKEFDDRKFNPKPIYDSGVMKVLAAFFKPGQFIPVHTPGIDLVLYVIEGEGQVAAGDDRLEVKAGDLVVVPRNEARGVLARTAMTVLHMVQPPPTEADHQEVHTKLQKGSFE
jgi:quercetin dioxygenase-like cupin family protein